MSQKDEKLFEKAEVALKNAINNEPHIPRAYESLGYLYIYFKDADTAKKFLTDAHDKFPNNYKFWLYLGMIEYKSGHTTEALTAVKSAYVLNPRDNEVINLYKELIK